MEKVNTMAEQSAWFRQYEAYVNGGKKTSDGKKVILLIVPLLVIGGLIAMMIKNGALNNDQSKNGVYVLAGIGAFLFIMMLILISKTKKSNAAEITAKDLNELLKSPQDVADFDAQMQAAPLAAPAVRHSVLPASSEPSFPCLTFRILPLPPLQ